MPIHLPPISRRRFLAGTLAAGAGLLLEHPLFAKEAKSDPNILALVSDIHLSSDKKKMARGINMADQFSTVAREISSLKTRPAAVLVNGDLAFNSGELDDYKTIAELFQPIRESGIPMHLTMGNHDQREHFWNSFTEIKAAKRPLVDYQASLVRLPRANWFILDSLEKTLATPGLLGEPQLQWLAKTLDENKDKPAIVMAHHNLSQNADIPAGLKDGEKLLEIIRPRKQVKAYIFGHTHNYSVNQDESGIHLINLPPPPTCLRKASRVAGFRPRFNAAACGRNFAVWTENIPGTGKSMSSNGALEHLCSNQVRLMHGNASSSSH